MHLPWSVTFAAIAVVAGVFCGLMYGRRCALGWAIAAHACVKIAVVILLHSPLG